MSAIKSSISKPAIRSIPQDQRCVRALMTISVLQGQRRVWTLTTIYPEEHLTPQYFSSCTQKRNEYCKYYYNWFHQHSTDITNTNTDTGARIKIATSNVTGNMIPHSVQLPQVACKLPMRLSPNNKNAIDKSLRHHCLWQPQLGYI